jgi:transposase-like protein
MPKTRQRYSPAKRQAVLQAAQQQGLTAVDVQKRYGVTPVTYYSWRKKYGKTGAGRGGKRRGRPPGSIAGGIGDLTQRVRSEVQSRVRELMAGLVRNEVDTYLSTVFAGGGPTTDGRRGRRRRRAGRPRKATVARRKRAAGKAAA